MLVFQYVQTLEYLTIISLKSGSIAQVQSIQGAFDPWNHDEPSRPGEISFAHGGRTHCAILVPGTVICPHCMTVCSISE